MKDLIVGLGVLLILGAAAVWPQEGVYTDQAHTTKDYSEPGCWDFYEDQTEEAIAEGTLPENCVYSEDGEGVLCEGVWEEPEVRIGPPTVQWPGLYFGRRDSYELGLASDGTVRWRERD